MQLISHSSTGLWFYPHQPLVLVQFFFIPFIAIIWVSNIITKHKPFSKSTYSRCVLCLCLPRPILAYLSFVSDEHLGHTQTVSYWIIVYCVWHFWHCSLFTWWFIYGGTTKIITLFVTSLFNVFLYVCAVPCHSPHHCRHLQVCSCLGEFVASG